MANETELWWTCRNCGYEEIMNEGEEFNDLTGEHCPFCQNGSLGKCEVYRNGKKIGEFE